MSEYREKTHLPETSSVNSGPLNTQNRYALTLPISPHFGTPAQSPGLFVLVKVSSISCTLFYSYSFLLLSASSCFERKLSSNYSFEDRDQLVVGWLLTDRGFLRLSVTLLSESSFALFLSSFSTFSSWAFSWSFSMGGSASDTSSMSSISLGIFNRCGEASTRDTFFPDDWFSYSLCYEASVYN